MKLVNGLALDGLSHERSRSLRDRAARSIEPQVGHYAVNNLDGNRQSVATEGVVASGPPVCILKRPEVPRAAVVVENNLLIKVPQVGHQLNTSRTFDNAVTKRSMSPVVLYMASEARAVAGTPKRSITGWVQW